ncbi:rhodanese-like domain-containing protein [Nitrosopumilus ureiphilus]|uniref:rhodanese-like domain-containing protein n=1 Tax=Nitrosopumilus ureiphilus TaxID=1470067 RepID=UPI001FEACDCF|nr:rhodanese-like domain-containing protein [Nitrosopumilus ureiphilus]
MGQTNLEISSEHLKEKLSQKKAMLLFDLRSKDIFKKFHVDGSVHAVCDTHAKEQIMPKIPKNINIVLISESENIAKK